MTEGFLEFPQFKSAFKKKLAKKNDVNIAVVKSLNLKSHYVAKLGEILEVV